MDREPTSAPSTTQAASDALVVFGITGDLARKQIFPALYAMCKRGTLSVPVIGVASSDWDAQQLHAHATDSIQCNDVDVDRGALDRLLSLLHYVRGDYKDAATFDALKRTLGDARRPAHYLAIPPSLFPTVIERLSAAGKRARQNRPVPECRSGRDRVYHRYDRGDQPGVLRLGRSAF